MSQKASGYLTEYRSLKLHLINILHCSKPFCVVCLATDQPLSSIDDPVKLQDLEGNFTSTLRRLLVTLFDEIPLKSGTICKDCTSKTVSAYLFVHNTRKSSCVLEDYIRQINKMIDDVDRLADTNFTDFSNTVLVLQDPDLDVTTVGNSNTEQNSDDGHEVTTEILKTKERHNSPLIKQTTKHHKLHTDCAVTSNKLLECTDCEQEECVHHKYLVAYGEQRALGQMKISCPDCSYKCWKKALFIAHINQFHLKKPSIVCEHCSKPLFSKDAYKVHLTHFHSEMLICEYCSRNFQFKRNLLKHKEFCNRKIKEFLCDKCHASFISEKKLEYHKEKHHTADLNFPCQSCDKVFVRAGLLNAHTMRVHTNSQRKPRRSYECGICHTTFETATERNRHKLIHNANDRYNCLKCGLEFETQTEFVIHTRNKHYDTAKVNHFKCTDCDYSTKGKDFLEAHVNRFHLKLSPYPCTQCPKKFTSTTKLKTHLKIHNPVKKHSCDLCGKFFSGPVALRKHKRIHTGEKPYVCDVCDRRFICASSRNAHIDSKHKPKSIECPLCPHMFHTLPMLRTHVKKMHWQQDGEFDVTKVEGLKEEHYQLFRDRRFEMF